MRDAVWNFVSSREFLIGGLCFGLVFNILAGYIKQWLDGIYAQFSTSRRKQKRHEAHTNEVYIWALAKNSELIKSARHQEMRFRFRTVVYLVFGAILMSYGSQMDDSLYASALANVSTLAVVAIATREQYRATEMEKTLRIAEEKARWGKNEFPTQKPEQED